MKKLFTLVLAALSVLAISSCELVEVVEVEEEVVEEVVEEITEETTGAVIFSNEEIGLSFEYSAMEDWTEPTVTDDPSYVRSYDLLDDADYSLYTANDSGRPYYDWIVEWGQDMENAVLDPPDCNDSDACAFLCEGDECISVLLNGYDYSDLDVLKDAIQNPTSVVAEEEFISDYEISGNRVLLVAHNSPGLALDAYISNGEKTVTMIIIFGFEYTDTETYTIAVREEVQTLIDEIAASIEFL